MNKTEGVRKKYEDRKDLAGEHRWGDTGQLIFLFIFIIGVVLDIFVIQFAFSIQTYVQWYIRVPIFIALFLISGYFAWAGLKKVFHEERKTLQVIDTGVFNIIRHPIYFGSLLMYLSFVVLTLSLIGFIIWSVIFVFYFYLCTYEEQLLIQRLGTKYEQYMKRVPMLLPKPPKKS